MNLNLTWSRRWRRHGRMRVHASRERTETVPRRYRSTQVYVELHDDIGLPHTLYNVGSGVFPSIPRGASIAATRAPRCSDASPRWRVSRRDAIAATPVPALRECRECHAVAATARGGARHHRDHAGPPPQVEEGALEVRQAPKYLRDEARPFENFVSRAPQGYKGEEESFSKSKDGHDVPAS